MKVKIQKKIYQKNINKDENFTDKHHIPIDCYQLLLDLM